MTDRGPESAPTTTASTPGIVLGTCPQCGAPAEITDRRLLGAHDSGVEHGRVLCVAGHRFVMPVAGLEHPAHNRSQSDG